MKKTCCVTLALALSLVAGTTQAFSLGDAAKLTTAIAAPDSAAARSAELVTRLTDLNVDCRQAVGGATALLDLAKTKLAAADYAQLLQSVPALRGMTDSGLAGQVGAVSGLLSKCNPLAKQPVEPGIQSMTEVAERFAGLGMAPAKVSEFTPVLLQFIGSQGASQPLVDSLTTIWATPVATL